MVANLRHALTVDAGAFPPERAVTLPALRITVRDLVAEIARQCDAPVSLVSYAPEPSLEAAFGTQPPLETVRALDLGFQNDGDLATLVSRALARLT